MQFFTSLVLIVALATPAYATIETHECREARKNLSDAQFGIENRSKLFFEMLMEIMDEDDAQEQWERILKEKAYWDELAYNDYWARVSPQGLKVKRNTANAVVVNILNLGFAATVIVGHIGVTVFLTTTVTPFVGVPYLFLGPVAVGVGLDAYRNSERERIGHLQQSSDPSIAGYRIKRELRAEIAKFQRQLEQKVFKRSFQVVVRDDMPLVDIENEIGSHLTDDFLAELEDSNPGTRSAFKNTMTLLAQSLLNQHDAQKRVLQECK